MTKKTSHPLPFTHPAHPASLPRQKIGRIAHGFPGERRRPLPADVVQRALALPFCKDICVTSIGRFDRVPGHYVERPAGCPHHVLIFCLDGQGSVRIGASKLRMRRGHGVILPPGIAHQYAASSRDPWAVIWFHFTGARAADCAQALTASEKKPRFWVEDAGMIIEAFEECYRHVLGGYTDADLIGLSTSFTRFMGLCRTLRRAPNTRRRHAQKRIAGSVHYMRENLHRKLTLGQVARETGMSVSYFCARFKRQFNCGPLKFFEWLKMQRACELLECTEHRVSEIASALGFDDPFYFSRRFRFHTGASPASHRTRSRH